MPTKYFYFIKRVFTGDTHYYKEHIAVDESPYFWSTLFLVTLSYIFPSITEVAKASPLTDSWGEVVTSSLIISFIFGYIGYLLVGFFTWITILLSKGNASKKIARNISLYTSLIFAMPILLYSALQLGLYDTPSQVSPSLILESILECFFLYSVFVLYKVVIATTNVDHTRAKFWFLWVTGIFSVVVFVTNIYYLTA